MKIKHIINEILKEENDDLDWIRSIPGDIPPLDDENKFLALVELLGIDEVFGNVVGFDDPNTDFKQNGWDYFGIDTFTLHNGEEWAVGSVEEFNRALYDYWIDYPDMIGDISDVYGFENYLTMSDLDRRLFAQEQADYYVDVPNDEIVEMANLEYEMEGLEERISELEDQRDGIDTSIDDQISDLEKEKVNLIDRTIEELSEGQYDEWYECLSDPYNCLVVEHGFYENGNQLLDMVPVFFDYRKFAEDMTSDSDWGELSHYDGNYHEIGGYVLIRLD